jgi:hypothetical protein
MSLKKIVDKFSSIVEILKNIKGRSIKEIRASNIEEQGSKVNVATGNVQNVPGDKSGKIPAEGEEVNKLHDKLAEKQSKKRFPGDGIDKEEIKKSMDEEFEDMLEKSELVKALDECGMREPALNLQNWNELDDKAKGFIEDMVKSFDDEGEFVKLEKKYIGFSKLKGKLASKGARSPGGLAAYIGRKKYGKKGFQSSASKGKKMR